MPLVWAHAEYVKLCRSLEDGAVFDRPPQTVARYLENQTASPHAIWRFSHKCRSMPAGQILRLELLETAVVHWSLDNWQTTQETRALDTGLGLHIADLPTAALAAGAEIVLTFHWLADDHWQGEDFVVQVSG